MKVISKPLVPSDCDLKDFPFTPIFRARLFGSSFHAKATDAEWRAGVTLWLKSQDQFPSGSLPDDDIELCRLAELGRDVEAWLKLRVGALHGWVKCKSDGRLYNAVVAEVSNKQWRDKLDQRGRTLKARIAHHEKRLGQATGSERGEIEGQLQELRQALSQRLSQALSQVQLQALSQRPREEKRREGKGRESKKGRTKEDVVRSISVLEGGRS